MAAANADGKNEKTPGPAQTPPVDAKPENAAAMKVIDKEKALDQCGDDPTFLNELLGDVMKESDEKLTIMRNALKNDQHKLYSQTAHAIKGAALNLHLEALGYVSKAAEFLGKALMATPADKAKLAERQAWVTRLEVEYGRLREYVKSAAAES